MANRNETNNSIITLETFETKVGNNWPKGVYYWK